MKKPVPERLSHFTEQKNKRSEALKAKQKAIEMSKHKTRTIQIERGLWIQVNDFESTADELRAKFYENQQRHQALRAGGKNVS